MANKIATLKNQAGDNIYPNIVGDNRNTAIKDSTTIKHTLAENKISLDLDEAIKGKIDAALQKPTGLTKTKLVGVGASGQENIEIGDNLTLANGKLSAAGGSSGKSVSPTLWLIDLDNLRARTTITEEEYNNLKNGLYNQVMYCSSTKQNELIAMYNPSKLFVLGNEEDGYQFIFTYFVYNESLEIIGLDQCILNIGEKNANNEYPFTVEIGVGFGLSGNIPIYEATYDSTSDKLTLKEAISGSPNILFVKYTNNSDSYTWLCFTKTLNISDSFGWQCIDYGRNKVHTIIANDTSIETIDQGLGQTTTLFNKEILVPPSSNVAPILPCTTADNGKVLSVVNGKAQWASAGGGTSIQSVDAYGEGGTTTIEKGKISTDLTGVDLKVPFVLNIYEDSTLSGTPSRIVMTNKVGEIYLGNFDFINHYLMQMTKGTDGNYSYASSIVPNATGNTLFNKPILVPEDLVDPTPILPCTAADNGKVLSVVNGEAQWASAGGGGGSTKLYQHNIILLENSISEYLYIKHISSKQSEVTNIADLNTLLGTGTYTFGCSGEVKINNTWHNAVAIYWDGSYAKSLVMYNVPSEGEKTASLTIYTSVADTVTPV